MSAPAYRTFLNKTQIRPRVPSASEAKTANELRVLVLNASHEMAKEITMQLNLHLPGCLITYAPSIELARWILQRRDIQLVIASPLLPDGSIQKLEDVLHAKASPPDLLVVGEKGVTGAEVKALRDYHLSSSRNITQPKTPPDEGPAAAPIDERIKTLGADLRNDLNNPLQEIVAMVFVAKNSPASPEDTGQALDAINRAAENMAGVVKKLESKIRNAVQA